MVLGQVLQINRYDVALALPNNLTGYIPLTSISDKLTTRMEVLVAEDDSVSTEEEVHGKGIELKSLFFLGQYLRAYVLSTKEDSVSTGKGKRRIELSVNPTHANTGLTKADLVVNSMVQATVLSVEDHGLIMGLGLEHDSPRAFMSSRECGYNIDASKIEEGAVFLCLIIGLASNGNVIKLSVDRQKAGNLKKGNFLVDGPTVDSFLPGTAVEIQVSEVTASGIVGKVMGALDVTADWIHCGTTESAKDLVKRYPVSSKTKARIVCTFPTAEERKLGVSLLHHVVSFSAKTPLSSNSKDPITPIQALPLSTIVPEVKVVSVEPGIGLLVDVGVKGVQGFVHISRVSNEKVATLSESTGPYKPGSVHRGRIVGYNPVDGLFLVSFEPRILGQPFLRLEDVQVGQVVDGTIVKLIMKEHGISGMLVNIAESITGLVPEIHFADVQLQHPELKYKEGAAVKARILSTNLEKHQIRMTLKKSLVSSNRDIWKSYDTLKAGDSAPGTIVSFLPSGAIVQFYSSVRGFLPVSEMSETYIEEPRKHFRIGQVVNVRIISVDPVANRMTVSCKDPADQSTSQQEAFAELIPGTKLTGTVSEKTISEIVIELDGSGAKAKLPFEHLGDSTAKKCISLAKKIRVGQKMNDLLLLSKQGSNRPVRITSKPSLIEAARDGTLLKSFEDVSEGAVAVGYVKNITLAGVFVQFGGELTGLLLKTHLPEEAIRLPDFGMRRDQSISVKILSIDFGLQRFLVIMDRVSGNNAKTDTPTLSLSDRTITDAVDGVSTSMDNYSLGKLTKSRIVSVKESQLNVVLADGVQGRIDVSEVFDTWEDIKDRKHPLKTFRPKQVLPVRILGLHDSRNHRFLPITHRGKAPVFELSAKPLNQGSPESEVLTLDKIQAESVWVAFVNNAAGDYLWVNISPNVRGRISAMDVSEDISLTSNLPRNFPVGSALKVRVKKVDIENGHLDLSARLGSSSTSLTYKDLSRGMVLPGRVTKVTDQQIMVQLSESIAAPVHLIDLADDFAIANFSTYQKNQVIRVCVSNLDIPNKRMTLSTRPSKVLSSSLPVVDPEIASINQIKTNDIVRGFVKNVADTGIFVSLSSTVTAYIRISDLSDTFIKDWKSSFHVGQLVRGKIIAIEPTLNNVQMSLKESVIDSYYNALLTYNDLSAGQIVTGKVRKVESFGVFILVDRSANVSGLCHRSEMADQRVADVGKLYNEGDVVKAKVLSVDPDTRRISFGLKASYIKHNAHEVGDSDEDSDDMDNDVLNKTYAGGEEDIDLNDVRDIDASPTHEESLSGGQHNIMGDSENGPISQTQSKLRGLSAGGFDWTGGMTDVDDIRDQSDTDGEATQPTKKRRKKAEIQVDRTGDLDANGPQSVADFERLLLGRPDSSILWLGYMAFQLQLSEVDKAREIAERALRTINIREDSEKLNVWVALLNLENAYGSDDTVDEVFKRACSYNDTQDIHERLASIYIQSGKNDVSPHHTLACPQTLIFPPESRRYLSSSYEEVHPRP